jgi:hypothetical protein
VNLRSEERSCRYPLFKTEGVGKFSLPPFLFLTWIEKGVLWLLDEGGSLVGLEGKS